MAWLSALRAEHEAPAAPPEVLLSSAATALCVVDANVLIKAGVNLASLGTLVTVDSVLREVRDGPSRAALEALAAPLATRQPPEASVAAVRRFARLTGDAAVLSNVDVALLALAHALEVEAHGPGRLRDVPPPARAPRKGRGKGATPMPGWDFVESSQQPAWAALEAAEAAASAARGLPLDANPAAAASRVALEVQALQLSEPAEAAGGEDEAGSDGEGWEAAVSRTVRVRRAKRAERELAAAQAAAAAADVAQEFLLLRRTEEEERTRRGGEEEALRADSGEEDGGSSEEEEEEEEEAADETEASTSSVALVTADFAMQNVALQMGLRLVAPDGLRITRLQRWVLRCHACFGVTRDLHRHFCGRCGNAALQRVTLHVDASGAEHIGVRRRHNLRGTRYSLPAPKAGRRAVNPVLREDQLAAMRAPSRGNKGAADVFAPEFNADEFARQGSLAAAQGAHVVGMGKNPNQRRHQLSNRRR